jgi:hypothetical protein
MGSNVSIAARAAVPIFAAFAACSCAATIDRSKPGHHTLVGISRVTTVPTKDGLVAYRIRTLGAGAGPHGGFAGWRTVEEIVADPSKCQLVVIIRSSAEGARTATILEKLKGEDLCVADYSKH